MLYNTTPEWVFTDLPHADPFSQSVLGMTVMFVIIIGIMIVIGFIFSNWPQTEVPKR
jgi:putative flippase GtrA